MEYKGFQIEIESLDGNGYSCYVYRISDGRVLMDEWNPSNHPQIIEDCKRTIDDYYKNPDLYDI